MFNFSNFFNFKVSREKEIKLNNKVIQIGNAIIQTSNIADIKIDFGERGTIFALGVLFIAVIISLPFAAVSLFSDFLFGVISVTFIVLTWYFLDLIIPKTKYLFIKLNSGDSYILDAKSENFIYKTLNFLLDSINSKTEVSAVVDLRNSSIIIGNGTINEVSGNFTVNGNNNFNSTSNSFEEKDTFIINSYEYKFSKMYEEINTLKNKCDFTDTEIKILEKALDAAKNKDENSLKSNLLAIGYKIKDYSNICSLNMLSSYLYNLFSKI